MQPDFNKINIDKRHKDLQVIDYGFLSERLAPNWYLLNHSIDKEFTIESPIKPENSLKVKALLEDDFGFGDEDFNTPEVITILKKSIKKEIH